MAEELKEKRAALSSLYESIRSDERTFAQIQITLFSVAIAALAVVSAVAVKSCQFAVAAPGPTVDELTSLAVEPNKCDRVSDWVLALLPLAPFAFIAFAISLGGLAVLRSYYMRGLEDQLQPVLDQILSQGAADGRAGEAPSTATAAGVPVARYGEFVTTVTSLRRGFWTYRGLVGVVMLAIVVVFGGLAIAIGLRIDSSWAKLTMFYLYGVGGFALAAINASYTSGGRTFFDSVLRQMQREQVGSVATTGPKEGLLRYLILPRPDDLVKALFLPGVAFYVAWVSGSSAVGWPLFWACVLAVVILDVFFYQARYYLNDVNGHENDGHHPERKSRRRIPYDTDPQRRRAVRKTVLSAIPARIFLGVVTLFICAPLVPAPFTPGDLERAVLVAGVAVFVLAFSYEAYRDRLVAESGVLGRRGLADGVMKLTSPPNIAPRQFESYSRRMLALVGLGYTIRGGMGLAIARFAGADPSWLAIGACLLFLWTFGVVFVSQTWALELMSLLLSKRFSLTKVKQNGKGKGAGKVQGNDGGKHNVDVEVLDLSASEVYAASGLLSKSHLLGFSKFVVNPLPEELPVADDEPPHASQKTSNGIAQSREPNGRFERPLMKRTRLSAPWNSVFLAVGILCGALPWLLQGWDPWSAALGSVAIGLLGALGMARADGPQVRWVVALVCAVAFALLACSSGWSLGMAIAAAVPWTVVSIWSLSMSGASYFETRNAAQDAFTQAQAAFWFGAGLVLGPAIVGTLEPTKLEEWRASRTAPTAAEPTEDS